MPLTTTVPFYVHVEREDSETVDSKNLHTSNLQSFLGQHSPLYSIELILPKFYVNTRNTGYPNMPVYN